MCVNMAYAKQDIDASTKRTGQKAYRQSFHVHKTRATSAHGASVSNLAQAQSSMAAITARKFANMRPGDWPNLGGLSNCTSVWYEKPIRYLDPRINQEKMWSLNQSLGYLDIRPKKRSASSHASTRRPQTTPTPSTRQRTSTAGGSRSNAGLGFTDDAGLAGGTQGGLGTTRSIAELSFLQPWRTQQENWKRGISLEFPGKGFNSCGCWMDEKHHKSGPLPPKNFVI